MFVSLAYKKKYASDLPGRT